jgi:hypothetical protein
MLAPYIIELLIGCSFLLLAGWAGDEIRAGRRALDAVRPTGWNQMGRQRKPWPFDDSHATRVARTVKR